MGNTFLKKNIKNNHLLPIFCDIAMFFFKFMNKIFNSGAFTYFCLK